MPVDRKPGTAAGLEGLAAVFCISWLRTQFMAVHVTPTSDDPGKEAMLCSGTARYAHPDVFCSVQHRSALEFVLIALLWFGLHFAGCFCLVFRLSCLCRAVVCASVQASAHGLRRYEDDKGKNGRVYVYVVFRGLVDQHRHVHQK